ncbi:hypothetical protein HPP92_028019 [Vanilla planifolia]|uniref:U5 small nuclear ribonucleoprotein TSSC4 n=1 Tax=Vanilla planifolia TaxID=51239 RepID=A0A835P9M0_VANPL|nr:hypothetical protein HPP92_028019 [Vanilla planifolia]
MEDSFEVRVKRLFGSHLFESVPRSSFPASSWSVAGGEVERREWNRERDADHDRSEDPCSSAFADGGCFVKKYRSARRRFSEESELDLDEPEDDADGEGRTQEEEEEEREEQDGEEREIRSSIGLDTTLDNEDEEDEFDRAAIGREEPSERLYMRDVKMAGSFLNYHNLCEDMVEEPSVASQILYRDPRADHLAASVRLKEDEKVAGNFIVSDSNKDLQPDSTCSERLVNQDLNVKPILKRKEALDDSKPRKRVRFGPNNDEISYMSKESLDQGSTISKESTNIPDYIRNPSKYTRYTFDSYEEDEAANMRAFEGFQSLYQKTNPKQLQNDIVVDLPKSLTFTPRKKYVDAILVGKDLRDAQQNGITKEGEEGDMWPARSMGIAAGEFGENDASCKMEEDITDIPLEEAWVTPSRKGRQYRSRSTTMD